MMPIHHIHLAIILGLAFVTATAVYLYLTTGKSTSGPLKIAGVVLLVILIVNSLAYFAYYSLMYSRWN
jgi:hypothetical protein